MYTDYWGLKKPPFDNVPDPTMYVEAHRSVENTVAETLFAIEEGNECLTVIVGDVGLGKTLSLRIILDSLDHEKYKIAFVTNPDMSFVQLLREIIGQLTGKECEVKGKIELLEVFNKLLFSTADEGKKVLIFVDEANAISPPNLESLRLLTNMQDDDRNLFTIVLAGQMEFAKRLEHPRRANLFSRVGTYNRIERIESEEVVKNYVETRLRLAGATKQIFTDDAIHWLWEYSGHGVPRLINKIAKLCLKAAETNEFYIINGEVVQQIGDRFGKMTGPAVQKHRPTGTAVPRLVKKEVPEAVPFRHEHTKAAGSEKRISPVYETLPPPPPPPVMSPVPEIVTPPKAETVLPEAETVSAEPIITFQPPPVAKKAEEEIEEEQEEELEEEELEEEELEEEELEEEELEEEELEEEPEEEFEEEQEEELKEEFKKEPPVFEKPPVVETIPEPQPRTIIAEEPVRPAVFEKPKAPPEPPVRTEVEEDPNIVYIAGCRISIEIPPHILEQTQLASTEQRRKVAGVLAAQTLEKNPQLTASPTVDPVSVWSEILNIIMKRLDW